MPALLAALGAGIAVPLVWDGDQPERRLLSATEIEQRLIEHPFSLPFGRQVKERPISATCKLAPKGTYKCVVWYRDTGGGIATQFGYDLEVDAYETPSGRREAQLREALKAGYRRSCRREPPPVTVHCDEASDACTFSVGRSHGVIGYNDPPEGLYC